MELNLEDHAIPVDVSSQEEGDLLPDLVRNSCDPGQLTEVESALCDGEGGTAPSKGTRSA